MAVMEVLSNH